MKAKKTKQHYTNANKSHVIAIHYLVIRIVKK